MDPLDDLPLPLHPFPPYYISSYSIHSPLIVTSAMRARIVPPYPSFTYVMSQIDNSPDESQAGPRAHGDASLKSVPRPYSKYDDNPFMVRMHFLISVHEAK